MNTFENLEILQIKLKRLRHASVDCIANLSKTEDISLKSPTSNRLYEHKNPFRFCSEGIFVEYYDTWTTDAYIDILIWEQ